jgi:hypothetical protein
VVGGMGDVLWCVSMVLLASGGIVVTKSHRLFLPLDSCALGMGFHVSYG